MVTIPSPSATAVVPALVSPSIIFNSVVVTEAPSKISSSVSLIPADPIVTVPENVTLAPLNVIAVVGVEPDLITSSPLLFVKLPKVVPPSFKITSAPFASNVMSVSASITTAPSEIKSNCPSVEEYI